MFDDNNDDDFLEFNNHNNGDDDRIERLRKAQRIMFINDIERFPSEPMPVGVEEFINLFGNPTSEDKDIMTQAFIRDYLRIDIDDKDDYGSLCAKWGLDWLELFINHNVEKEEYELCSIIKEVLDNGRDILQQWMKEDNIKYPL